MEGEIIRHNDKDECEAIQDELTTSNQSLYFHLSKMPVEWVEDLTKAALKCRDRDIINLCELIPQIHAPLAKTLTHWANDFMFDLIIDLIQAAQTKQSALAS